MARSAPPSGPGENGSHADHVPLLAGIARGQQADLAALFDATGALVLALARRLLGDAHLAEEVLLEVFLQVWEQAERYDPSRGRPEAWLMMLTRSRALDKRRAGAAWRRQALPLEPGADLPAAGADPGRAAEHVERSARVQAALAGLPLPQRQALELSFYSGLSHGEIAARLREPLGTVKTRVRRGLLRLREVLAAPDGQEGA